MKKILSVLTVLALVCMTLYANAEEAARGPYDAPDDSTVRVVTYAEGSEYIGTNLSKFETTNGTKSEDDPCIGEVTALFNAAAPMKAIVFKVIWAGKSENDQDADYSVEVFGFEKDIKTSVEGTALFSETRHRDGDADYRNHAEDITFRFAEPLPAGKYVLRVTQLGTRDVTEGIPRYIVLPAVEAKYADAYIQFGGESFGFMVDFVKTEGVSEYFTSITGEKIEYEIEKEQTLAVRDGGAFDFVKDYMGEYAILTPVIPDGKVLYSVNLVASPTWSNTSGDSNVDISVYKWKGDYDKTLKGKILLTQHIEDHKDNTDLIARFDGQTLRYGNRYLIVFNAEEGSIGYWSCSTLPEGWEFYGNYGDELDVSPAMKATYAKVGDLGPEPTEEPTEVPTEKPTDVPTQAPATPTTPSTPAKTATPANHTNHTNNIPIIITAVCAAVIIASVTVTVIVKKKKA